LTLSFLFFVVWSPVETLSVSLSRLR